MRENACSGRVDRSSRGSDRPHGGGPSLVHPATARPTIAGPRTNHVEQFPLELTSTGSHGVTPEIDSRAQPAVPAAWSELAEDVGAVASGAYRGADVGGRAPGPGRRSLARASVVRAGNMSAPRQQAPRGTWRSQHPRRTLSGAQELSEGRHPLPRASKCCGDQRRSGVRHRGGPELTAMAEEVAA
jgi:hypothetical protein